MCIAKVLHYFSAQYGYKSIGHLLEDLVYFVWGLEIEPRALHMLSTHSTAPAHSQEFKLTTISH
jgi:hypothetical protein